jgi:hypothetical protein
MNVMPDVAVVTSPPCSNLSPTLIGECNLYL